MLPCDLESSVACVEKLTDQSVYQRGREAGATGLQIHHVASDGTRKKGGTPETG